ncbi:MAG: hypothetical protein HYR85_06045 [Planctomycetes bacterium]|nr:hypothetical protein [Planctomycetota bacterium]MBI3846294.1 hypothetical protein [Planctomycetota bacterium]
MHAIRRRLLAFVSATGVASSAALTSGCATAPRDNLAVVNNEQVAQDFAQLRIRDVAVLPVRVGEGESESVGRDVRDEVKQSLVAKLYSPLSFDTVDRKLGPVAERRSFDLAKYKGSFDEDAILTAELTQWDGQWLRSHNQILLGATFSLYHSKSGKVVWSRELRNRYIDISGPVTADNARDSEKEAIRKFVREAMRGLPRKIVDSDLDTPNSQKN